MRVDMMNGGGGNGDIGERSVKRVKGGHYVATHRPTPMDYHRHHSSNNNHHHPYSTDGEDSHRAISERTLSEYTLANENSSHRNGGSSRRPPSSGPPSRIPPRAPTTTHSSPGVHHLYDQSGADSDIYVTSAAYRAPSEMSRYSAPRTQSRGPRSVYSVASTTKTGRSGRSQRQRGARIEAMSAPNPFCPNAKGVCCLMLLINLGLILVTLGFIIVIQFVEPVFVYILGIVFLIFGFLTLIGSMVYCVIVCRDAKTPSQLRNEDLYWTKHWQKSIGYTPQNEINYKADRDRYGGDGGYSDRYSVSKYSERGDHNGGSRSASVHRY